MPNRHVVPRDGKWANIKEGSERASSLHDTQREAEKAAKAQLATEGGGEVRIHSPDGRIRDSDTVAPGNDPYPPRDKKH